MNRNYIIIGAIVIVAVLGIFIFVLTRTSSPTPAAPTGTTGTLPNAGTQSGAPAGTGALPSVPTATASGTTLGLISTEPALNYYVDASNNVFIAQPDGKIEEVANGGSTYLSSSEIQNVLSADFSYDGKKALVSFGASTNPQWSVFDVATKSWSALPISPLAAAWAPNSEQIAYFVPAANAVTLATLDLSNAKAKPQVIMSFPNEDFTLTWKSPNDILLVDRPGAFFAGSIFDVNIKTATISNVIQSKVGLEVKWNSDSTQGIIFVGTSLARGGQLGIVDRSGNLLHQLSFLTLPSKCVFPTQPKPPAPAPTPLKKTTTSKAASTTPSSTIVSTTNTVASTTTNLPPMLICGIPRDNSKLMNNPLPDTYEEKIIMTADDFYTIDLNTGNVTALFADPSQIIDSSNLTYANNNLFFISRYDKKLYAITFAK